MRQLKMDDNFQNLEFEELEHWQSVNDIPEDVLKFIDDISKRRALYLYNDHNFYCPFCLSKLRNNFRCPKCHKSFKRYKDENDIMTSSSIESLRDCYFEYYYYVFDIQSEEVLLYILEEDISYNNPLTLELYRTSNIKIKEILHLTQNGYYELLNKNYYSYKSIDLELFKKDGSYNLDTLFLFDNKYIDYNSAYLYVDNLNDLKDTIYRYTKIWQAKDYLKKKMVRLSSLVYAPLHFKSFEYLMQNKLYNLAFNEGYILKMDSKDKMLLSKNNKYLKMLIKYNFGFDEYLALRMCPTLDLDLICFLSFNIEITKKIQDIANINFVKLKNYFAEHKYSEGMLVEYYDYLKLAQDLGFDLKDKKVLYPENLIQEHDKLYLDNLVIEDKNINKKIKKVAASLMDNYYEDENYVIKPILDLEDLIDEGTKQHNCVRTYAKDYANDLTHLYVMRKKSNLAESFVTIEEYHNKIIQARCKYNEAPDANTIKIIQNWVKTIKR